MDNIALASESILAVVGLTPFLEGKPIRLTDHLREEATALPFRWRRMLRGFLAGTADLEGKPSAEPFDYDAVRDALTEERTPEALAHVLALDEPDIDIAVAVAAGRALDGLRAALPSRARVSLLGAEPVEPSGLEVARFKLLWQALDKPSSVIREMAGGILTRRQAAAFRDTYPALYDLAIQLLAKEATDLRAERPNHRLPRARELQLGILTGTATRPDLAAALQGNFATKDEPPPKMDAPRDVSTASQTPVQRIENR